MVVVVPLLIAIVGLIVYGIATNPKVLRVAELSFFAGLLAFLLQLGPHALALLK